MSEEEMIDAIFDKIIRILVLKDMNEDIDNTDPEALDSWLKQIPVLTIASVICAHLKLFLGTIIQNMTYYKKKHLFFCPKLNRKRDPRVPKRKIGPRNSRSRKSYTVSSVIAYETTLFTAKDFFQMLKDHQDLIPERAFYHRYMERLVSMDSVKPFLPRAIPNDDDNYEEVE